MSEKLRYFSILGTEINVTDMDSVVHYVQENIDDLRGHYICVSNVHTTVTAYRQPTIRLPRPKGRVRMV